MKTWNGKRLYECSVCHYATIDEKAFEKHKRLSGHVQNKSRVKGAEIIEVEAPKKKQVKEAEKKAEEIVKENEVKDGEIEFRD